MENNPKQKKVYNAHNAHCFRLHLQYVQCKKEFCFKQAGAELCQAHGNLAILLGMLGLPSPGQMISTVNNFEFVPLLD